MAPRATSAVANRQPEPQRPNRATSPRGPFDNVIEAAGAATHGARPQSATLPGSGLVDIRAATVDGSSATVTPLRPSTPASGVIVNQGINSQRQQQINDWVEHDSDPSGGFLGFGQTPTSDKLKDILRGQSELGPLSAAEQRFLMDRMLDRWTSGHGEGPGGVSRLSHSLGDAPEFREIISERIAVRAADLATGSENIDRPSEQWQRRMMATSYAISAVTAASGPAGDAPTDLGPLQNLITVLRPSQAASFAWALADDPTSSAGNTMTAPTLSRTLIALNGTSHTEATSAFVQNAFALATVNDYHYSPDLRDGMAQALAREWYPEDPAKQRGGAARLAGILATDQGRQLLGSSGPDKAPLTARVSVLATIRTNSSITADTLRQTDDPWTNPVIVEPQAQSHARQLLATRGDAPQRLQGSDLDNTVGYAMGLSPSLPTSMSFAEVQRHIARGELSLFAQGPHAQTVKAVIDQIRQVADSDGAQITVLPVTYSSVDTGPVQLPLFRVAGPDGQDRFVDNIGRAYDSFGDWKENNQLPPGSMTYAEGGHLTALPDGTVALGHGDTPKTVDTFGEQVSQVLDTAALVGGVVAGGVLIIGTGGLATPLVVGAGAVAVGAGAWGAYRNGSELADRAAHDQSIDPFSDETARGLWLNVGANALAIGAFGSAARLAQLGRARRAIAPVEASVHGYAQASAALVDTAAIANESIYLSRHWGELSGEERAQSLLSMGFWAAGTGASMRAGGVQPGDMYSPIRIRDGLLRNFAPPVLYDPSLPGDAVKVNYDPATGIVQDIRHGSEATTADIDLHVRTAQNIQRSLTLEGQLRSFFTDHGEPLPGSAGWAARIDIGKVRERMETRSRDLANPETTPQRRAEIVHENAIDQQHLDELADDVESFVRDPNRAIEARNAQPRRANGERGRVVLEPGNSADGWNQTLNGELRPNTEYVVGRYTYVTDNQGRVAEASGRLRLFKHDRNTHQQGKASEIGGIKDAVADDEGGHLFAAMFDGPGEQINYHAMTHELNGAGGDWYNMEQDWRSALEQGQAVDAKIRPIFEGDSKRPEVFRVTYWIDGKKHTRFFDNAAH